MFYGSCIVLVLVKKKILAKVPYSFHKVHVLWCTVYRYYLADGVRFCAQSTWLEVFRDQGRRMVARHLPDTLEYYIAAAQQVLLLLFLIDSNAYLYIHI